MKYHKINLSGGKYKFRKKDKIVGLMTNALSLLLLILGVLFIVNGYGYLTKNQMLVNKYTKDIAVEKSHILSLKKEKNTYDEKYNQIVIDEKKLENIKRIGTSASGIAVSTVLNKIEKQFDNKEMNLNECIYSSNKVRLTIEYSNLEKAMAFIANLQKEFGDVSVVENMEKIIVVEIDLKK